MDTKKRILILTADAGFGHRSAANAISEALLEKYGEHIQVEIVNPLDESTTPTFLRETQSDYDKWIRNVPELYQLGYKASDSPIPTILLEQSLAVLLIDSIREVFRRTRPDAVITTFPNYQSTISALFVNKKYRVPFFTVVTDLSTVHRLWFHRKVSGCLVPNKLVAELAMSCGMPPEKIFITGIPVSPAIAHETREKDVIRKELGWQTDIPTILAVGSKRVDRLIDTLNVINHFGNPLQIAVVAGKDQTLLNEINQFDWHIPAHIFDYVENMPALLKASDLIVCKAGGLIVTESLASGLPMMLIEVIPGQETGNAEYVTAFGAADMAQSPIEVLESLNHLLKDDRSLLRKRAENAKALGLPQSAFAVADILWYSCQNPGAFRSSRKQAPPMGPF
ncbi:MAG: glycosyltransferase [Chloroflexi bacterium]|nr:glycosyltransferase [Chloroflexota bacterium]